MQLSHLEDHEFIGEFFIKRESNGKRFSGKITYTANIHSKANSGIELYFISKDYKIQQTDIKKIYGKVMSIPKMTPFFVKLENVLIRKEDRLMYKCECEYILLGNSEAILDAKINKIDYSLMEIARFFNGYPPQALLVKKIYNEEYDDTRIDIDWNFGGFSCQKFSSYLNSHDNDKKMYYAKNAESLDKKFKEFLQDNNIGEFDVACDRTNIRPVVSLTFSKYEDNCKYALTKMFETLLMFWLLADYPIKPEFINLTTDSQSSISVLCGRFLRNEEFVKNRLGYSGVFVPPCGLFSFQDVIFNNKTDLFAKWNKFYSDFHKRYYITSVIVHVKREGRYNCDFVLDDILAAMHYIGGYKDINTNFKSCLTKYGTDLIVEKIALALFGQKEVKKVKQSKGPMRVRDKLENKIAGKLEGPIRNIRAHASAENLKKDIRKSKQKAIQNGLIDYLLMVVEYYCYKSIGIDDTKIKEVLDNRVKLIAKVKTKGVLGF